MNETSCKELMKISDVSFSYDSGRMILDHINLEIHEGELIVLLGPNGAGKSTLLNCIMAYLTPSGGKILLDGADIHKMSYRDIARIIAYVPQSSSVTFSHTVREYVAMGRAPYLNMIQKPSREDYTHVDEVLEMMNISKLRYQSYSRLSGGERQMVDVCRALVQSPRLILFDEPTSALDYGNQIRVLRLIKSLSQKRFSVLLTTHNPDHPLQLGGTVCVLSRDGQMRCGSAEEIMQEDYLNEVYHSRLKIRYFDEDQRNICVSEKL